ncbi:transcriptional repressor [bacterium]|nr:transcriptional repressor [bacterium]
MMKDQFLEKFRDYLRKHGLRMTSQRLAILEAATSLSPSHFDVTDILALIGRKKSSSYYGRATVYRTLEHLVEAGILRKLQLASGAAVFELAAGVEHHEHLICEKCGRVIEFECAEIERLQDEVCTRLGFKPKSHILRISGVCSECSDSNE